MDRAILDRLIADRAAKRPVALVTRLDSGAQTLVAPGSGGEGLPASLVAAARRALQDDDAQTVEMEGARWFIDVFNPPLRLVIVGAVHIAQPLSRIAAIAGYEVVVIDPRSSFATDARFPGVTLVDEWPDDGLASVAPDRRTAIVTLTHDPKLDDPALMVALRSEAFYVGSLGSRRTHASRVERLTEAGLTEAEIGRIHAPVGLDIEAVSPAEIAVAILAQIIAVLHHKVEEKVAAA